MKEIFQSQYINKVNTNQFSTGLKKNVFIISKKQFSAPNITGN